MPIASLLADEPKATIDMRSLNQPRHFTARKMSFNQEDDHSHQSECGESAEMGGSSCSHSSSSSCVDASEEEDDQDGILPNVANLFEDEEA